MYFKHGKHKLINNSLFFVISIIFIFFIKKVIARKDCIFENIASINIASLCSTKQRKNKESIYRFIDNILLLSRLIDFLSNILFIHYCFSLCLSEEKKLCLFLSTELCTLL